MAAPHAPDSRYAVGRLLITMLAMTIGNAGMYAMAVVLPAVQAEFGVARADASMPYTALMLGFGFGGILTGKLADRFGVSVPLLLASVSLAAGYAVAGAAPNIGVFTIANGLLIGALGCSATLAPLVADTSLWFVKRRGLAVAVCASGNYVAGMIWPPVLQSSVEWLGWRQAYTGLGVICLLTLPLLAWCLRARPPIEAAATDTTASAAVAARERPFGLPRWQAQALLCVAGLACCVAMSMPQVHIVAYCTDLGFGAARGAEMLSLMLGLGIISRVASGWICDRIGGLRTLLLGSALQGIALLMFLPSDGLVSLYLVSAMFGLFQGGIVPSYAIIVREHFPAAEVGSRVGTVLMFTLFGMALGGWLSGKVFDLTGSYHAAFFNGIAWNALNLLIAASLWWRVRLRADQRR